MGVNWDLQGDLVVKDSGTALVQFTGELGDGQFTGKRSLTAVWISPEVMAVLLL